MNDIDTGDAQEARRLDRAFASLQETALECKAERDRFEAALRKIAGWKGYRLTTSDDSDPDYEQGANDMLATLKQMAEEALS